MERVSIRLIGDREQAHSIAQLLKRHLNLNWTEYPAYMDKERTKVCEGKVMLYATARRKKASKTVEQSLLYFLK